MTTTEPPAIAEVLKIAHLLRDGAAKVTQEHMEQALSHGTHKCYPAYASVQLTKLQCNPAAWLASRVPQTQSVAVIALMIELTKEEL